MTMKRNNGGFTLVELIVTIAIGSMITIAASTTLLLGLRINAVSTSTVTQQKTTNMLVYVLENIAEKGPIAVTAPENAGDPNHIWQIKDVDNGKVYLLYCQNGKSYDNGTADDDSDDITLDANTIYLNGIPFMTDVETFKATYNESTRLLTITIQANSSPKTGSREYTSSIYCRLEPTPTPTPTPETPVLPAGGEG